MIGLEHIHVGRCYRYSNSYFVYKLVVSVLEKTGWMIVNKEICLNPWGKCESGNVKLYIMYKGEKLPICEACWRRITAQGREW